MIYTSTVYIQVIHIGVISIPPHPWPEPEPEPEPEPNQTKPKKTQWAKTTRYTKHHIYAGNPRPISIHIHFPLIANLSYTKTNPFPPFSSCILPLTFYCTCPFVT